MGDVSGAIELYHKALSMKPDDTFTVEMLNRALQEFLDSSEIYNVQLSDEVYGKASPCNSLAAGFSAMRTRSQKSASLDSSFDTDDSCVEMID